MTVVPTPGRRRVVRAVVLLGLLAATMLLVLGLRGSLGARTVEVDVPAGTADRIAAGETIELLPRLLHVEVGDALVIRNEDDAAHQVGPYLVAAGQVLRQRFTAPGVVEGVCTLHPSGEIAIVVT